MTWLLLICNQSNALKVLVERWEGQGSSSEASAARLPPASAACGIGINMLDFVRDRKKAEGEDNSSDTAFVTCHPGCGGSVSTAAAESHWCSFNPSPHSLIH